MGGVANKTQGNLEGECPLMNPKSSNCNKLPFMKAFFRGEAETLFPYGLISSSFSLRAFQVKSKQFSLLRLVAYAGISPMTPLLRAFQVTSPKVFARSKGTSPYARRGQAHSLVEWCSLDTLRLQLQPP